MMVPLMYQGVVTRAIEPVKRGAKHEFVSATLRSFIREVTVSLSLSLSIYVRTNICKCVYTHNIYNEKVVAGTENYQRQAPSLDSTQTDLHIRHSQPQILI